MMEKDQILFIVAGYEFLKAGQIDLIVQEIMATDWYSQWLPQDTVTIRAEMRADRNRGWLGLNDLPPVKRAINFSLSTDTPVTPKIVNQIIAAFSEAFITRMMAMRHGTNPEVCDPVVVDAVNKDHRHQARKRQPNIIEWESYPIKAMVRRKHH